MPTLVIDRTEHPLEQECILGRHRSCGIQVVSEAASRQHAKILPVDGLWWIEDLGSANGTQLNGAKLTARKRLRNGDLIAIGKVEIAFREAAEEVGTAAITAPPLVETAAVDITAFVDQVISGYRIDRFLGRNLLGAVYKAHQLNLDRPVAFKIFDPARCIRDAGLSKRFLGEAGKVGSITHDGLVQLHESGEHQGLLWCSMEWVAGDTLEKLLARDGRLEPTYALLIGEKIADALGTAHAKNVIHGDLRPSHVIVMADGRVKLTDVGMMGIFDEAELPAAAPASEAWYVAPEAVDQGASDPRSDMYSLGCLLFQLLTGKPPFAGRDYRAVVQAHAREPIPSLTAHNLGLSDVRKYDALLATLLAKQPTLRPSKMSDVAASLSALRQNLSPTPAVARTSNRQATHVSVRQNRSTETSIDQQVRAYAMPILVVLGLVLAAVLILPQLTRRAVTSPQSDNPRPEPATPSASAPAPAPVEVAQPAAAPQAPAVSPLAERWKIVSLQVDQAQAKADWPAAENILAQFAPQTVAESALAQVVKDRSARLAAEGESWYRKQIAAMPAGETPAVLAARVQRWTTLRNVVPMDNRDDANSRYQEAMTKLGQQLDVARRQARQLLDNGKVGDLPKLASVLGPALSGTTFEKGQRYLAILCSEAAGIAPLWQTNWSVTRQRLLAVKGERALGAAAALMLAGDVSEAKALLAQEPALMSGELLRRREAIAGRVAALLTFDQAADLSFIAVATGEPRMQAGSLTASAGEPIELSCSLPINTSGWDVAVGLTLESHQPDGQAMLSLIKGQEADVQVRVEGEQIILKARGEAGFGEAQIARPAGKGLRVRIAEHGGTVQIFLNDQFALAVKNARVSPGAQLHFEAVGMTWGLTDVQVVAGD